MTGFIGTNLNSHILPVAAQTVVFELQRNIRGHGSDGCRISHLDVPDVAFPGDRSIHGAGIEEFKPEPFSQLSGRRAFSGSCRTVNRDNHACSPDCRFQLVC